MSNLLISFSGGETSGYMTHWLLENRVLAYDDVEVVFANTGEEHEETLEFVRRCDEELGFDTTWVEADVHHGERKSSTHTVVSYESASRDGEPFEEVIRKYGIPNRHFPHCTREMKTRPIRSYVERGMGWSDYETAIGIRYDEIDRIDPKRKEKGYVYPLCEHNPTTKPEVNAFWAGMSFRLELKGYEGNCQACWKKSFRKLYTIAQESPEDFAFMSRMEREYEDYTPQTRNQSDPPYRFYREGRTVEDIMEEAESLSFRPARDDSEQTEYQTGMFGELDRPTGGCDDHCEPF